MITPPLTDWQTFVMIIALALGIMATRFIPFLLFTSREKLPQSILYLGSVLPHAAMAMLLVYCIKDISLFQSPHGAPEALAILFTGLMQWRWNNVLASIAGGTVMYMGMVQGVF